MARNKENLNEWQRKYYQKKKNDPIYAQKKKTAAIKSRENNKESIKASNKKYRENNLEKYNKYRREYRYENPVGIYSVIKDGLNNKKRPRKELLNITKDDFVNWYTDQKKECFYCKRTLEETRVDEYNQKANRLTIDRVDNNKGYELGNIVLACLRCNSIKSNYFSKEEMLKIGEIIHAKTIR